MQKFWIQQLQELISQGYEQGGKKLYEDAAMKQNIEEGFELCFKMIRKYPTVTRKNKYEIPPIFEQSKKKYFELKEHYKQLIIFKRKYQLHLKELKWKQNEQKEYESINEQKISEQKNVECQKISKNKEEELDFEKEKEKIAILQKMQSI